MQTLFLPSSVRSHSVSRIASTAYAKCGKYFHRKSKNGSLLAALLCTVFIAFPGSVFAEDANSDVKPGILFYLKDGKKASCVSKKAMVDLIKAAYAHDQDAMFNLLDGECSPLLPTDVKMKVDRVESFRDTDVKIVAFHNSTEPNNKWTFYTLASNVSASTPPTPYGSYLQTPFVGAAASRKTGMSNLKAGDSFYFNPKFAISCVNSQKIAELYKYAAKHDLINFNHMLLGDDFVGCMPHVTTEYPFEVMAIEKIEGTDENVVHFYHANSNPADTTGYYTLIEFIGPKRFPDSSAAR